MVVVEGEAPTVPAAAATAPNGGGGGGGGEKAVVRQGLVSSITVEPLRCHPSDAPGPADPSFAAEGSLPNFCPRMVVMPPPSRVGDGPSASPENSVPLEVAPPEDRPDKAMLPLPPPAPLREESVNVGASSE